MELTCCFTEIKATGAFHFLFFNPAASFKRLFPANVMLVIKKEYPGYLYRTEFIAKISKRPWGLLYAEIKLILCMHLVVGPSIEVIIAPC